MAEWMTLIVMTTSFPRKAGYPRNQSLVPGAKNLTAEREKAVESPLLWVIAVSARVGE